MDERTRGMVERLRTLFLDWFEEGAYDHAQVTLRRDDVRKQGAVRRDYGADAWREAEEYLASIGAIAQPVEPVQREDDQGT